MRKLTLLIVVFGPGSFYRRQHCLDRYRRFNRLAIREVDDAYALVLAFHSPEVRIVG